MSANAVKGTKVQKFVPAPSGSFEIMSSDDMESKLSKLDIEGEFSVSLAAIPIKISGSAKYLTNMKEFHETIQLEVAYLNVTGSDKLDLGECEWNEDVLAKEKIESLGATHMVAEVIRGGRACLSFESQV